MANQAQPRPWFRLGSIARPVQPQAPPPVSAPRAQMQPPAAPLPRPMTRPVFRPQIATQPQSAQEAPRPTQVSRAPAAPPATPVGPPITAAAGAQQRPPPTAFISPTSPSKLRPTVATSSAPAAPVIQRSPSASPIISPRPAPISQRYPPASPDARRSPLPASPVSKGSPLTQKSPAASPVSQRSLSASPVSQRSPAAPPVIQRSHPASPVSQNALASPVTQKSPLAPRASQVSAGLRTPPSLPFIKTKYQSPSPSMPSSPAMKQELASPANPLSPVPPSLPSPSKPSAASAEQFSAPGQAVSPLKPSNDLTNAPRSPTIGARLPTPAASPRTAKPLPETPPQSPKMKHSYLSPPSFSLPPSQLNSAGENETKIPSMAEQKTVLHVQETAKPRSYLESHGDNSSKPQMGMHVKPKRGDIHKKASDSDNVGMRVITISGENTGAIMELGYSPRTHSNGHGFPGGSYRKLSSDAELSEGNLSSGEGRSKMHGTSPTTKAKTSLPMHAFTNSNVQGINSSIVFNSSLSHHDPGAHFSLARNPYSSHMKEHANGKKISHKEVKMS